jgi:hypothetical protein
MRRIQRYHSLAILGDLKPHPYNQVVHIGALHISNPTNRTEIWGSEKIPKTLYVTDVFETWLKRLINDGLVKFVETERIRQMRLQPEYQVSARDYELQLTAKGRDCLAMEQIARDGDYSYYKTFDGTLEKAKQINPGLFSGN